MTVIRCSREVQLRQPNAAWSMSFLPTPASHSGASASIEGSLPASNNSISTSSPHQFDFRVFWQFQSM